MICKEKSTAGISLAYSTRLKHRRKDEKIVSSVTIASSLGSTSQSSSSANLQLRVQLNSASETSGQNLSHPGSAGSMDDSDIVYVIYYYYYYLI